MYRELNELMRESIIRRVVGGLYLEGPLDDVGALKVAYTNIKHFLNTWDGDLSDCHYDMSRGCSINVGIDAAIASWDAVHADGVSIRSRGRHALSENILDRTYARFTEEDLSIDVDRVFGYDFQVSIAEAVEHGIHINMIQRRCRMWAEHAMTFNYLALPSTTLADHLLIAAQDITRAMFIKKYPRAFALPLDRVVANKLSRTA